MARPFQVLFAIQTVDITPQYKATCCWLESVVVKLSQ